MSIIAMRFPRLAVAALLLAWSAAQAKPDDNLFISKGGSVPVWISQDHGADKPVYEAPAGEILLKLDAKDNQIQVRTKSGLVGWISATSVQAYKAAEGQTLDLGVQKVEGYLDNPNTVFIGDLAKDPPDGVVIYRDLTLMVVDDNIDRESLERRYEENF